MPQEHYIITMQPGRNTLSERPEAGNPVTFNGLIETDGKTAEEVYKEVHEIAVDALYRCTPGVGHRHPVILDSSVVFYTREPNDTEQ